MDIQEYETLKNYCGKGKSLYFITRGVKKYPLTEKGEAIYSYMNKHKSMFHCFCANIGVCKVRKEIRPHFIALTNSAKRNGNSYVVNETLFLEILEKCGIKKSELDFNKDVFRLQYSLIGKRAFKKESERREKEKKLARPVDHSSLSNKESKSMVDWIKKTKPATTKYEEDAYKKFNRAFHGGVGRQVPFMIGNKIYFADMCIKSKNAIIEIDGGYHYTEEQRIKDEERDKAFASIGYQTIRIPNSKVGDKVYIGDIIWMLINKGKEKVEEEPSDDTPKFSLSEIRKYLSLHPVDAPAEYIYEYWKKKKWKTKKGVDITTHNIAVAVNVANGVYCQRKQKKRK